MKLAVIGTFYARHENSLPLFHRLFVDSTRKPDEAWLMCETDEDAEALNAAYRYLHDCEVLDGWPAGCRVEVLSTPTDDGRFLVLPYAWKINHALDRCTADAVVYLDNNSMPAPEKLAVMAAALEQHPKWGAVYCTQKRTGFDPGVFVGEEPVEDGYCRLNYTQVMHRLTKDRWPTDMSLADPDVADGVFWRTLHQQVGAFFPAGGSAVLDTHHIPSPSATLL